MSLGIISWILLLPVCAAGIILLIPKNSVGWIKFVALCSTGWSLLFSIFALFSYDTVQAGYQFVDKILWIKSLGISYHVGVDGISAVLLVLTTFCSFTGVISAFSVKTRVKEYFIFYLFLITGCLGVLCSLNVFFMYFFYETAVIPVFPLIGIWGSGNKEYAAMKLTLYLTLGAVLALVSVLAIYAAAGLSTFDFVILEKVLSAHPLDFKFQCWAFPLVMVGFGVILTLWPFHTWSPMGYAAAPTSVSMLHAGVLKKLGAYLIIRLGITLMPAGAEVWMPYVAVLAIVNILYCGMIAYSQKDLKYILGYSSCSHMGIILLGLACLNTTAINGTVYFMFAHGITAALGFGLVGFIYEQTHTRQISELSGLGKRIPFVSTLFVITALASSGVPGFANFIGEIIILIGAWTRYPILTIFAILGLVVTAGYMLKTVRAVIQGPLEPPWPRLQDVRGVRKFAFITLTLVLIIAGCLPSVLLPYISSSAGPIMDRIEKRSVVIARGDMPQRS
jgi:NADH-quinone oxidoreductase subunit M